MRDPHLGVAVARDDRLQPSPEFADLIRRGDAAMEKLRDLLALHRVLMHDRRALERVSLEDDGWSRHAAPHPD